VTDVFPPGKRSEILRRVRPSGTGPELRVKELLERLGAGHVHQARVPGWRAGFLAPGRRPVIECRSRS
jgi:G:T-mismatch repair DNA endonuclease (very short patch repair protein)